VLAAINLAGATLLVLGGLLVLAAAVVIVLRGRARGQAIEIPPGMRPGPSDAALETPLLHKLQGWGVVMVAFFVVWFPFTWIREPGQNLQQDRDLLEQSVDRGRRSVEPFSESNQLGVGCVNCHGPELQGGVISSRGAFAFPPDLTNICAGPFGTPAHPAIFSQDDIRQVIMEGRPADDPIMPSWSIRFRGALDDQQIDDLVNYLIEMSSENVPFEDNVCLNPEASARALEANAEAGGPINPRDP
jgi:mono/diheme cytochrome c family protein